MNIFEDDKCVISINDPQLWDMDVGGVTGEWRIDQFGNIDIQCWYEYTVSYYVFLTHRKRGRVWIDEDDFIVIDKINRDPTIPHWKHFVNGVEV